MEYLQAQAKHYKAPTWAEEDTQENGVYKLALSSTDLEEDGVYLVRCFNTGNLEALELYNDFKKGVDIHYAKTTELPYTNPPAQGSKPVTAKTRKQTKHTNLQILAEEAAKGKPELSFEEIVPK